LTIRANVKAPPNKAADVTYSAIVKITDEILGYLKQEVDFGAPQFLKSITDENSTLSDSDFGRRLASTHYWNRY